MAVDVEHALAVTTGAPARGERADPDFVTVFDLPFPHRSLWPAERQIEAGGKVLARQIDIGQSQKFAPGHVVNLELRDIRVEAELVIVASRVSAGGFTG